MVSHVNYGNFYCSVNYGILSFLSYWFVNHTFVCITGIYMVNYWYYIYMYIPMVVNYWYYIQLLCPTLGSRKCQRKGHNLFARCGFILSVGADDTRRCFNLIMTYMEWSHSTDILQIGWNKASFLRARNKHNFPSKFGYLLFKPAMPRAKSVQLLSDDDMLPLHSNDCCSPI